MVDVNDLAGKLTCANIRLASLLLVVKSILCSYSLNVCSQSVWLPVLPSRNSKLKLSAAGMVSEQQLIRQLSSNGGKRMIPKLSCLFAL